MNGGKQELLNTPRYWSQKMSDVAFICQPKDSWFSVDEVKKLIPLLTNIARTSLNKIERIRSDQRFYMKSGAPQNMLTEMDNKIGAEMQLFFNKVRKLGARALGDGWLAFDTGSDHIIWRYYEPKLVWRLSYGVDPALFRRPA